MEKQLASRAIKSVFEDYNENVDMNKAYAI